MTTSIELSSGIVIDTEGGRAYVMAPQGGVTAISLQDGSSVWHSENADKPLLLKENLLLSQALPKDAGNGVAFERLAAFDAPLTCRVKEDVFPRLLDQNRITGKFPFIDIVLHPRPDPLQSRMIEAVLKRCCRCQTLLSP